MDVIDSEFARVMSEMKTSNEFQYILKSHRNFLANLTRLSFIDNNSIQESIDRLLHVCLRFLAVMQVLADENEIDNEYQSNIKLDTNVFPLQSTIDFDNLAKQHWKTIPIIVPPEEIEAISREFFTQLSFLFQVLSKIDNRGFIFRLDFNGYLSQVINENMMSGKLSTVGSIQLSRIISPIKRSSVL